MNMYMILLESIHNDRCFIVLSNNTVRRVWLNYRLQFIKQLMVIQCSNMHVFHCSGRLELLCYSLKGYGHDFSWNISNFVFIFLTSNVLNLNIVLCLNIIFMSKRVTSKIQSWLILCNVNKIHMPCFCLREPIKISLHLFFSIFWNLNMNTNSFEIFFISFKKNWNTGFLFFFFSALSVNNNIKQNWKTFSSKLRPYTLKFIHQKWIS